jgi:hypothetical protein
MNENRSGEVNDRPHQLGSRFCGEAFERGRRAARKFAVRAGPAARTVDARKCSSVASEFFVMRLPAAAMVSRAASSLVKVVFDWKSDVAPLDADGGAYRQQLGQYLHVLGAQRGAIVYPLSAISG